MSVQMKDNCKKNCILFIMAVVFVLTLIKSVSSSITWDEAFTYVEYVVTIDFFDWNTIKDLYYNSLANNHWLNTFLINVIERLTGITYNELIIRLPSLIFFAIYLYCVWLSYTKNYISFFTAILLCGNYYLNEFYGLARGYSMANTLIFLASYFYMNWRKSGYQSKHQLLFSITALWIATLANTIAFMIYPAFGLLYLFNLLKNKNLKTFLIQYWWYIAIFTVGSFLTLQYHFNISAEGLPLYTGDESFYSSVIQSYIHMFVNRPWIDLLITVVLFLSILLSMIMLKKNVLNCDFFLMLVIFIMTNWCMHHLTDKGYMTGRVTIPFYSFIVLAIFELFFEVYKPLSEIIMCKYVYNIILLLICVICFISYKNKYNPYATIDWRYDCERREEVLAGYISLSLEGEEFVVNKKKTSMSDIFYNKKYSDIIENYTDRFHEDYQ